MQNLEEAEEDQINYLEISDFPESCPLSKVLRRSETLESSREHRRDANFFVRWIIFISEEKILGLPKHFYGSWQTNTFIYDEVHGYDASEIRSLNRVEKRKRIIEEEYWEEL